MDSTKDLVQVVAPVTRRSSVQSALDELLGGEPGSAERLWARPAGEGTFEILNIPAVASGLSYGDRVRAVRDRDNRWLVQDLVGRSGHRTIHLAFAPNSKEEARQEILAALDSAGAGYERSSNIYYAVTVPPEADFPRVVVTLEQAREVGTLQFEISSWSAGPGATLKTRNVHPSPAWGERADAVFYVDLTEADLPGSWEEIPAQQLAAHRFRVCCIPFFAYDLALGDEVQTVSDGQDTEQFQSVIGRSEHWTFRVSFVETPRQIAAAVIEDVVGRILRLGCAVEWQTPEYISVDAPTDGIADALADMLWDEMQAGRLTYEAAQGDEEDEE